MEDKLTPSQMLWPNPDVGPWRIELFWKDIEGRIECVGIEMRSARKDDFAGPTEPHGSVWAKPSTATTPTPLTTSILRDLPLGTLVKERKRMLSHEHRWWASREKERHDELLRKAQEWEDATHHKPGPEGRSSKHYAEVARIYRKALNDSKPPTQAVAKWGRVTKSAAAKWVYRARKMGLLPETTRGRVASVEPPRRQRKSPSRRAGRKKGVR